MRWCSYIPLGLLVLLSATASAKSPTVEELKAKAERAHGNEQAKLYAEIVRELVEVADQQYTKGDVEVAQKTVSELIDYVERIPRLVKGSNKKLKDIDLILHKAERRLGDVARTLAVEDRPQMEAAKKKVEDVRTKILEQFFGQ